MGDVAKPLDFYGGGFEIYLQGLELTLSFITDTDDIDTPGRSTNVKAV